MLYSILERIAEETIQNAICGDCYDKETVWCDRKGEEVKCHCVKNNNDEKDYE